MMPQTRRIATFHRIQMELEMNGVDTARGRLPKDIRSPIGSKEAAEAVMGKSDAVMAQEAALGREWATDDAVENS